MASTLERSPAAAYFRDVGGRGSASQAGPRCSMPDSGEHGRPPPAEMLDRLCGGADLLLNVSGMLDRRRVLAAIPVRAFSTSIPAFTQLWHEAAGHRSRLRPPHPLRDGRAAVGRTGCRVPTCGRAGSRRCQPVVLEHWPVADRSRTTPSPTTVGNWRAYGSIEHEGVHYGQKAHSLRRLIDAARAGRGERFAARARHPPRRDATTWRRWPATAGSCSIPIAVAAHRDATEDFIRGSKAEFGIAKSGYVASRCGWFSDRSVCYLASGRPVLAQDTGFSEHLPTGDGLFAFRTVDEAVAAIEALRRDYARHRRAARAIAEEVFDSDRVLSRLLSCL